MAIKFTGNAGHCPGIDAGAVGPSGLEEANVAKEVTELICGFLQVAGFETKFVQDDSLQTICDVSNEFESDVFVSIHCNAFSDPSAHGMEVWTSKGDTAADALATFIALQLSSTPPMSELALRTDMVDGDVDKESNFWVLKNTDAPAVLVELAFISNPTEEALLADAEVRKVMAAAIARGITDFIRSK